MVFKTQYDDHSRVHLNPGERIKKLYSASYTARGVLQLKESGEEDLYGYIQSHRDSVDIHVLVERFNAGEEDVLSRFQGFYADASQMPSTYAEVLNSVIAGENAFASLPVEIKQRFGNSFSRWLTSMEEPDFAEKMGFVEDSRTAQQTQDFVSNSSATQSVPLSAVAPAPAPSNA